MADVRLSIASREYIVTCRDGEEAHLYELARMVDDKVREAGGAVGGLSESRQLLFAALLLADQVKEGVVTPTAQSVPMPAISDKTVGEIANILEKLAERIETFAAGLEHRA
ncbi:MAG: cell division protein ZapA [Sphingorhabdus sp.]